MGFNGVGTAFKSLKLRIEASRYAVQVAEIKDYGSGFNVQCLGLVFILAFAGLRGAPVIQRFVTAFVTVV